MSSIKSALEMQDLFFSEFSFAQKRSSAIKKISTNIAVSYATKVDDKNQVKVQIDLTIKDEGEELSLFLRAIGYFKLILEDEDNMLAEQILKKNTVSIMLPYIRSQVSLLTTQPGLTPIMLQPIDVNELIKD